MPFSAAVRAGNFVYVSGAVALDDRGFVVPGGIEQQTRRVFENLSASLALAGCDLDDVVKVNVWLDDERDFFPFNQVYAEYFPGNKPARSTVQSRLMMDAKVEIDLVAYKE
ncbi:endoribonuclease L-PSP family protein (plasmid) [Burkholderia pseudomallei]|uniref:Endoribonuclease L-PSP family protein n=2 Tax=Burkholderia pseudomallei TaxID=28450 RepID=A0AA40JIT7_BURPE|nr:endoribonuclease L-PSP family protein [Burkholderia pseudomallei]KGD54727.1 rutC family protein [Burkholderia pseudomallei]KGS74168.1 endoribonuclease L-PSP family protein [Burkholderia pseudomallei MSHR5596]KGW80298.1 endoribonuclease L-PSP family protein [Burkholderia pseudomallei MSHR2990]KGX17270.1 endoribonuclease L-PSP family protein [Burkholderia pseudomallei]